MSDEIDRAQEREQQLRDAAIADQAHRAARERELLPVGYCHYCGAGLRGAALFCALDPRFPDESCARDYDHAQAARLRNGG